MLLDQERFKLVELLSMALVAIQLLVKTQLTIQPLTSFSLISPSIIGEGHPKVKVCHLVLVAVAASIVTCTAKQVVLVLQKDM